MNIFDPRNYGANPNDNIDDTQAIQSALDAAKLVSEARSFSTKEPILSKEPERPLTAP